MPFIPGIIILHIWSIIIFLFSLYGFLYIEPSFLLQVFINQPQDILNYLFFVYLPSATLMTITIGIFTNLSSEHELTLKSILLIALSGFLIPIVLVGLAFFMIKSVYGIILVLLITITLLTIYL